MSHKSPASSVQTLSLNFLFIFYNKKYFFCKFCVKVLQICKKIFFFKNIFKNVLYFFHFFHNVLKKYFLKHCFHCCHHPHDGGQWAWDPHKNCRSLSSPKAEKFEYVVVVVIAVDAVFQGRAIVNLRSSITILLSKWAFSYVLFYSDKMGSTIQRSSLVLV